MLAKAWAGDYAMLVHAGPDRELQGSCLASLRLVKQLSVSSTGPGQAPGHEYSFKRWREGASPVGASSFAPGENVVLSIEGMVVCCLGERDLTKVHACSA